MQAWLYTLIPAAAAVLGAAVAVNMRPGPVLVSAIQHFAAGVVFAAAAGEIAFHHVLRTGVIVAENLRAQRADRAAVPASAEAAMATGE